jgi:hypothetical protein
MTPREKIKAAINEHVQLRASGAPCGGWALSGLDKAAEVIEAAASVLLWRPIDCAPLDGTVVDLWRDGERLTGWWWSQTRKTWITHSGFPVVTVCLTSPPTHWMPQPAPPVLGPGEGDQGTVGAGSADG